MTDQPSITYREGEAALREAQQEIARLGGVAESWQRTAEQLRADLTASRIELASNCGCVVIANGEIDDECEAHHTLHHKWLDTKNDLARVEAERTNDNIVYHRETRDYRLQAERLQARIDRLTEALLHLQPLIHHSVDCKPCVLARELVEEIEHGRA